MCAEPISRLMESLPPVDWQTGHVGPRQADLRGAGGHGGHDPRRPRSVHRRRRLTARPAPIVIPAPCCHSGGRRNPGGVPAGRNPGSVRAGPNARGGRLPAAAPPPPPPRRPKRTRGEAAAARVAATPREAGFTPSPCRDGSMLRRGGRREFPARSLRRWSSRGDRPGPNDRGRDLGAAECCGGRHDTGVARGGTGV